MTENKPSDTAIAADKAGGLWGELAPVIAFIVIYNVMLRLPNDTGLFSVDTALYWATGFLIAATSFVIGFKLVKKQTISPMLIFSTSLIVAFGTLGILLQSKAFIQHKPTLINLIFAGLIFGGLATGRNLWKMLMDSLFNLPDFAWRTLAIRWGLYFIALAFWNEFLVWNYSEEVWANWRLGNLVFGFIFMLANTPYMLKHLREDEEDTDAGPDADAA